MRNLRSWITAFALLHLTTVNCQVCPDTRRSPVTLHLADIATGQNVHNKDAQDTSTHLTCKPVTFPSDNRLQAFSGQKLSAYIGFWRSSQSAASLLPIAVVITFHSQACAFSQALLPLVEEVAQHYSKQSIRFLSVDTAQLAYSDMIKMGITVTPVIRLHSQVKRLTFAGNRTVSALTDYITEYTGIAILPSKVAGPLPFSDGQMPYTMAPHEAATASIADMRSWAVAPLTLLAECIVALYVLETMWKQPFVQRSLSGLQSVRRQRQ